EFLPQKGDRQARRGEVSRGNRAGGTRRARSAALERGVIYSLKAKGETTMTKLYRIRRIGALNLVFVKSESLEAAVAKFAEVAGLKVVDRADYFTGRRVVRCTLSNGSAIDVAESNLRAISHCHPALDEIANHNGHKEAQRGVELL